jgi:hypothetical protein
MDEARAVLDRLERIRALDASFASPQLLLVELHLLFEEVACWLEREPAPAAQAALDRSLLAEKIAVWRYEAVTAPAHGPPLPSPSPS